MKPVYLKKVKRNDRLASWAISIGGLAIIFCVIFILVLIVEVSLPLFMSPTARQIARVESGFVSSNVQVLAVGMDDYLETAYTIDAGGTIRFINLADGRELEQIRLRPAEADKRLLAVENFGRLNHVLHWDDGSLSVEQVKFSPFYDAADNNRRSIRHTLESRGEFPAVPQQVEQSLARVNDEGRQTRVDLFADGRLEVQQREVTENFLGEEEVTESSEILELNGAGQLSALVLNDSGTQLYAGTATGELLHWSLEESGEANLVDHLQAFADQRRITALSMVFGDVSLAVGDERGQVSTWFGVRGDSSGKRTLTRIHQLTGHAAPVDKLSHSLRDKTVLSRSGDGLHLDYMTSERFLLGFNPPGGISRYALTARGDGLVALGENGDLLSWRLFIPHPEISLKTLFGKVWYEGYDQPEYVWQSSAASDDYEPKLSLTPLIFGSLKGTFYAMLFAVPLAIFGAIYTSQFARPKLRGMIKPAIEIMAAVPTVIIGFLAALWLAPLIESSLGSVFLSLVLLPAALMLCILLWQAARKLEPLKQVERGYEFLAVIPIIIGAVALASTLGPGLEQWLFAGDLKQWLFSELGTRYDPRNCIIIAFAMGFAVIPIIFTIAEDSLSNVPNSLKAASLALGASRWQTVWRVILPSASPGIFAGTMIGFGRAVGETMIVLMATGNTAIMDLSIFNGMRPLSANIAVEIPEAPVDGSLYRVLFLSAVILFILTFIVNTVAEIVRQRLRAKYGRF
ncbi:ABC transporter permease subunit [Malonomonas rubra]|uniref:ABC transporter permease subunit n=1 Tax=Malonomonas rubra TaxID=57040 RepID=UPI0026ED16FC|nr:ABC transporter permease subunit [Malonomonas rubra]